MAIKVLALVIRKAGPLDEDIKSYALLPAIFSLAIRVEPDPLFDFQKGIAATRK
jgi:hypothetical protein